jgi:hypothetical protein
LTAGAGRNRAWVGEDVGRRRKVFLDFNWRRQTRGNSSVEPQGNFFILFGLEGRHTGTVEVNIVAWNALPLDVSRTWQAGMLRTVG